MEEFKDSPKPEEAKSVLYHTVNFEFYDRRLLDAQKINGGELHKIFRFEHREENWASTSTNHRHEHDRIVSTFSFITHACDIEIPSLIILNRATLHLFDWMKRSDLPDFDSLPDLIYAGIRSTLPNRHNEEQFEDFTIETNDFLGWLAIFGQYDI